MKILSKKKIYLDYASGAYIDSSVLKAMQPYQRDIYANPSAIYSSGVEARSAIDNARAKIAQLLFAHSDEIIFTGSGTESDALAIFGTVYAYRGTGIPHIITSVIEHPAVLENCKLLESRKQAEVTYINVDEHGIINPADIASAIKANTILVSIMYANNEIGVIEPIQDIAKVIRSYRKENDSVYPYFHTDAAQAMNYLFTENIEKLGVDILSFNSSKIYGPKGVGVLYKKRNVALSPIYSGGEQEYGLRSGTENVASIVGVATALEKVCKIKEKESMRLTAIRDYAIEKLLILSSDKFTITLNGSRENRLPNNINISTTGISSELIVLELDALGIFVSERSACASDKDDGSYVIRALHKSSDRALDSIHNSLRISFGQGTYKKDIDILIASLRTILHKYSKWK